MDVDEYETVTATTNITVTKNTVTIAATPKTVQSSDLSTFDLGDVTYEITGTPWAWDGENWGNQTDALKALIEVMLDTETAVTDLNVGSYTIYPTITDTSEDTYTAILEMNNINTQSSTLSVTAPKYTVDFGASTGGEVTGIIDSVVPITSGASVTEGSSVTVCAPLSLANLDGVFTVAAATESSTVADFSNYGDCVDGYAPGEDILSTYLNNQYAYQDGTSMAAPIVSGAAAILLSQNPDLTNEELTALLSDTSSSTTNQTNQNIITTPATQITPTTPTTPITPIITPVITQPSIRIQTFQTPISYSPMTTITTTCTVLNVYEALMNIAYLSGIHP